MVSNRLSRRSFVQQLVGASFSLAGVAAACGQVAPQPGAVPAVQPTATVAPIRQARGGALIVGQTAGIQNTAPYPATNNTHIFRWAMFNPLVSLDEKAQPIPQLAESWSASEDRLTVTFKLRRGVAFHSGRAFTAEDAQWNIAYAQDPKNTVAAGAELKDVRLRVLDAATLEVTLPSPPRTSSHCLPT